MSEGFAFRDVILVGTEQAQPHQAGGGRGAGYAQTIEPHAGRHTGHGRAVIVIIKDRAWIRVAKGRRREVPVYIGRDAVHIGLQVFMSHFQPVVNNGDDLVGGTSIGVPYRDDIDVFPGRASGLAGIIQVPLIQKKRVVRFSALGSLTNPVRISVIYQPGFIQGPGRLQGAQRIICLVQEGLRGERQAFHLFEAVFRFNASDFLFANPR